MAISKSVKVLQMEKDKVTKGAVRFNDGEGHQLYFRKEEIPSAWGDKIEVTIKSK